jgi:hypothetical protein
VPPKTGIGIQSFVITSSAIIVASPSLANDRTKSYRLQMLRKHDTKYVLAVGKTYIWSVSPLTSRF